MVIAPCSLQTLSQFFLMFLTSPNMHSSARRRYSAFKIHQQSARSPVQTATGSGRTRSTSCGLDDSAIGQENTLSNYAPEKRAKDQTSSTVSGELVLLVSSIAGSLSELLIVDSRTYH